MSSLLQLQNNSNILFSNCRFCLHINIVEKWIKFSQNLEFLFTVQVSHMQPF